jgi:hypothetical protein
MRRTIVGLQVTVLIALLLLLLVAGADGQEVVAGARAELEALVGADEAAWLMATLEEIEPPERISELASWAAWQRSRGGGLYGLMPAPLEDVAIPVPADQKGRLAAALVLAKARVEARRALADLMPYPFEPTGQAVPQAPGPPPEGLRLAIDLSAVEGFLVALDDGVVSREEAEALAGLESNQEMLRHRRELGYLPEPLPTRASLSEMIERAGSPDPLARIWVWVNPLNLLGYADIAADRQGWEAMVERLRSGRDDLETTALSRIAPYLPQGVELDERFALTIGCLIRGWTTSRMAGLNFEQVKDDWDHLVRTMTEEVFHRAQLTLVPSCGDDESGRLDDLELELGSPALDTLYQAALYTVLEGSANLVAGPAEGVDDPEKAREGRDLLERLVTGLATPGGVEAADTLIGQGLRGNGPLYALGYRLATTVADADGARAVGALLQRGPVALLARAAELEAGSTEKLLGPAFLAHLAELQKAVEHARRCEGSPSVP